MDNRTDDLFWNIGALVVFVAAFLSVYSAAFRLVWGHWPW